MDWILDWSGYMPRGHCVAWEPSVLVPYVAGQLGIALAYVLLPLALVYGAWRLRLSETWDLPIGWYASFVASCGVGHVGETVVIWYAWYPILAVWHALTAAISLGAVVATLRWISRRAAKAYCPEELEQRLEIVQTEATALTARLEGAVTRLHDAGAQYGVGDLLHEMRVYVRTLEVVSGMVPGRNVFAIGADARYLVVDGETLRREGWDPDLMVGRTYHDVLELFPDVHADVDGVMRRVLAGERVETTITGGWHTIWRPVYLDDAVVAAIGVGWTVEDAPAGWEPPDGHR